ncbi:MAG: hypothetical protein WCS35_09785 [Sphaerochaeta sp.]
MHTDWSVFKGLASKPSQAEWVKANVFLLGDIHNHCSLSYGHGSLDHAIAFACQQLDFFSVTGHFAWPDMNDDAMNIPEEVKSYHREGFAKLRLGWGEYLAKIKASKTSGIIPFVSYEYHSFTYGDYTIVCKDLDTLLPPEPERVDTRLADLVAKNDAQASGVICMPHHIGYKEGYRGISWGHFNQKASPLVEIISMHGCSENIDAPIKYLHTMGPRSRHNTMQGGLALGYRFGIMGSTDHHNASPGSYGSGRAGVWAESKESNSIWDAFLQRKTMALSGDPIMMAWFIDDRPLGEVVELHDHAVLDGYILATERLSSVEVVSDGETIRSYTDFPPNGSNKKRFNFACGWGSRGMACDWNISIRVEGAQVTDVVPRLRGEYIVDPLAECDESSELLASVRHCENSVHLVCRTAGNVTPTTDGTQGFSFGLEIEEEYTVIVDVEAVYAGQSHTKTFRYASSELKDGPTAEYIDGFVSPAFSLSDEIDSGECLLEIHENIPVKKDGYIYLRAFQKNGDVAYSTPIWIELR